MALPPDVEAFGGLTPYGVALRYDEVFADAPAPAAAGDFDGMVMRTLAWAHLHLPQG